MPLPRRLPAALKACALLSAALPALALAQAVDQGPPNVPEFAPAFEGQTRAPAMRSGFGLSVEPVAEGLGHPWGIALLPGGGYLVTERTGTLRHVSAGGAISPPIEGLPPIAVAGQGGLLDIKVSPTFDADRLIYWTFSRKTRGGTSTAAARGRLSQDLSRVDDVQIIFRQTPAATTNGHFGSRIVFSGKHIFITTGDRQSYAHLAQEIADTVGVIVRILPDGRLTSDNPFVQTDGAHPSIWSYGHRNIQGAVIHPQTGDLWTIEHGPAGGDELNLIEKGANYGWPTISYGENYSGTPVGEGRTQAPGMEQPVYYWDPVIAPGDLTVYTGSLFRGWKDNILVASLNPGGLVRLKLSGGKVVGEERLLGDLGRIRDVQMDVDGSLLVLTDRRSGAVLRIRPDR